MPAFGAEDASAAEEDGALEVFALGKEAEVFLGDLDGTLLDGHSGGAGVFVADHLHVGEKAGGDAALGEGDVHAAVEVLRDGEVEHATPAAVRSLRFGSIHRGCGRVGGGSQAGDVEGKGVGEDSGGVGDGEQAFGEGVGVDVEACGSPSTLGLRASR